MRLMHIHKPLILGCRVQSTKSFMVTSPIPDSSMPYNVITLVSIAHVFINLFHFNCMQPCLCFIYSTATYHIFRVGNFFMAVQVSTLLAFFLGSFINALHKNSKKSAPVG